MSDKRQQQLAATNQARAALSQMANQYFNQADQEQDPAMRAWYLEMGSLVANESNWHNNQHDRLKGQEGSN